ncbi:RagB/SusD family nutrient uptake outer membrane protein [Prevotella sp. AGR2160]|uniref:RagB/SusD family nutrient uptake outer membrane protein n=1 Tax=Prevotella sp. AGR2160 TaxID=1280674 RepID=UPI00040592A9|nr:RagB/SusD family nutrient uptake outer membrane protein [Prevotella sp. AGR2160]
MKNYLKYIIPSAVAVVAMGFASCANDLDVTPIDPNQTTTGDNLADNLLNKCYANMAVAGQGGANGDCDITGLDGGTTGFVRQLFNSQDLTTDMAICGWGDDGIKQYDYDQFSDSHPMLKGLYYRLYAGIEYCNRYINEYGSIDAEKTAEARFLRAYYYSLLMDGWGNVPFTTKTTVDDEAAFKSKEYPKQISRANLFKWVVSELRAIENTLSAPTSAPNENASGYGRANKYTDQLLLARMYLNATVYAKEDKNDSAAFYAQQVIQNSPYKLHKTAKTSNWTAYQELFMGDNGQNGAAEECLLALPQDGKNTTSWGTTLFIMAGSNNGKEDWGIKVNGTELIGNGTTQGWGGNRMRPDIVRKFFPNDDAPENATVKQMYTAAGDDRALMCNIDRKLENSEVGTFTNGYAACKFNNYYTDGSAGKNTTFPDCDFFLFRIAEAYLTYAEATARENKDVATAQGVAYLNDLRARAHAQQKTGYSLSDICDEWAREFYFEGYRRTTLVRFQRFAGNVSYNWAWKGGIANGSNIDEHYNLFAIPADDINANKNLKQNLGY